MKQFSLLLLGLATTISSARADIIESASNWAFTINLYEDSPATVSIDFSGFPDNTPLSANNNTFDGLVTLNAQAGYSYVEPGDTYGQVLVDAGVFYQGSLYVGVGGSNIIPPDTSPNKSLTYLTLNFSAPVTQISFSTTTWPWGLGYTYHGVDANGNPFINGGGTPLAIAVAGSQHVSFTSVVTAPPGGYITDLKLENWDEAGSAITDYTFTAPGTTGPAFAFKDLVLTTGISVPEPSPFADRALLVFVLAAAPLARRKRLPRVSLPF